MKNKKKIIICAVVAVVIVAGIIAGVFIGKRNADKNTDVGSSSKSTSAKQEENINTTVNSTSQKTNKSIVFPSYLGYRGVMSFNDFGIVYDDSGLRIIDEKTEKVVKTFSVEYEPRAFDGRTLYIEKKTLKPDVKVNPEYMYGSDGDYMEGWDDYYVGELMKYTLSDGKLELIVETNCSVNNIVYFDENCLYYIDIPEDQIGYYGDYSPYGDNRN